MNEAFFPRQRKSAFFWSNFITRLRLPRGDQLFYIFYEKIENFVSHLQLSRFILHFIDFLQRAKNAPRQHCPAIRKYKTHFIGPIVNQSQRVGWNHLLNRTKSLLNRPESPNCIHFDAMTLRFNESSPKQGSAVGRDQNGIPVPAFTFSNFQGFGTRSGLPSEIRDPDEIPVSMRVN